MALFTTTSFARTAGPKGKKGKSSESVAYDLYQDELILLDQKYLDPWGNPTSQEYYDKIEEVTSKYLPKVSRDNQQALNKKLMQNRNEALKNVVETQPLLQESLDKVKQDEHDAWTEIWSKKGMLQTGNFGVMAMGMEQAFAEKKAQVDAILTKLKDVTSDEKHLRPIQEISDYYDDRVKLYRGVQTNPNEYRVDLSTNQKGEVYDVGIKRVSEPNNGYIDTSLKDASGKLRIYAQPANVDGVDSAVLGGTRFSNTGGLLVKDDASPEFSFSTLRPEDRFGGAPDLMLTDAQGNGYLKQDNGGYLRFSKDTIGQMKNQFRTSPISESDVSLLKTSFDVKDYSDKFAKADAIKASAEKDMQNYVASNGYYRRSDFGNLLAEMGTKGYGATPFKGLGKAVENTFLPTKEARETVQSVGEQVKTGAQEAAKDTSRVLSDVGNYTMKTAKNLVGSFSKFFTPQYKK